MEFSTAISYHTDQQTLRSRQLRGIFDSIASCRFTIRTDETCGTHVYFSAGVQTSVGLRLAKYVAAKVTGTKYEDQLYEMAGEGRREEGEHPLSPQLCRFRVCQDFACPSPRCHYGHQLSSPSRAFCHHPLVWNRSRRSAGRPDQKGHSGVVLEVQGWGSRSCWTIEFRTGLGEIVSLSNGIQRVLCDDCG